MSDASEITRRAKSNLAFALKILPKEQRDDTVVFYAYCRTMDDLADDDDIPTKERQSSLEKWKQGLTHGFSNPNELQKDVAELQLRHQISPDLLTAVIDGCLMDLTHRRFNTWDELCDYIWKVACSVGLVSIRLFQCQSKESEDYAVALGQALQLTNILRDVGEDISNDRVYLPLEELKQFGLNEKDLQQRVHDDRFLQFMNFQADRAEELFKKADSLITETDHHALRPARIMSAIYQQLLKQMRDDHFKVFDQRYSVSKARKMAILSKHLIKG